MDPRVDLALRAQPPKDDEAVVNCDPNTALRDWHKHSSFVILGRLSPKGEVDPRIHAVTLPHPPNGGVSLGGVANLFDA